MAKTKEDKIETPGDEASVEDNQGSSSTETSAAVKDILGKIEKMSVLDLNNLVKALEEKFGVSAQAPVAVAQATSTASAEPVEEKSTFDVILAETGANKLGVIKAVREIKPDLGLKDAKDLVEAAPKPILEGAKKEAAEEAKTKLEAAGAKVELR